VPAFSRLRSALCWRPEWPFGVAVVAAWVAMTLAAGEHHAHASRAALPHTAQLSHWMLMAVAMMLPQALPALRHVGLNSIRRRRVRGMTLYAASHLALWGAFGFAALTVVQICQMYGLARPATIVTIVVVASWQFTATKRRAMGACLRTTPLALEGWYADWRCMQFAVRNTGACIVACWPAMLALAFRAEAIVPMAVLTAVTLAEARTPILKRHRWVAAAALVAGVLPIAVPVG
jgi:predicted metal-binding membrane protein